MRFARLAQAHREFYTAQPRAVFLERCIVATNKPVGNKARAGAVKKRTQGKAKYRGATAWIQLNKKSGEFMVVMKTAKKTKAGKKFKGERREKAR